MSCPGRSIENPSYVVLNPVTSAAHTVLCQEGSCILCIWIQHEKCITKGWYVMSWDENLPLRYPHHQNNSMTFRGLYYLMKTTLVVTTVLSYFLLVFHIRYNNTTLFLSEIWSGQGPQTVRWLDWFNTNLQFGQNCMKNTQKVYVHIITQKFNWTSIIGHRMTPLDLDLSNGMFTQLSSCWCAQCFRNYNVIRILEILEKHLNYNIFAESLHWFHIVDSDMQYNPK